MVATPVQCALLALREEWRGEGGTHFLVELALRASFVAPLREGDAAAVLGHYAEVGHSQPVTLQERVCMSAWKECQYHAYRHTLGT